MTTGEYLVAHSTLPSGSALAHLLALQVGSGGGVSETVFASKLCIVTGEDRVEVTRRIKRQAPQPTQEVKKAQPLRQAATEKVTFAFLKTDSVSVVSYPFDEMYITTKQHVATVTRSLEQTTINRKRNSK